MPRILLPNARPLAHADLPILPFLAPRVFAEPPFRRANPRTEVRRREYTTEQNEKDEDKTELEKTGSQTTNSQKLMGLHRPKSQAQCLQRLCSATRSDHRVVSSRASTRGIFPTLGASFCTLSKNHVDLSLSTRGQLARYSTQASTSCVVESDAELSSKVVLRKVFVRDPVGQEPLRTCHEISDGRTRVRAANVSEEGLPKINSKNTEEMRLLDRRRRKALMRAQNQYNRYTSYIAGPLSTNDWLLRGRYRSLRRRIFALSQESEMELDLSLQKESYVLPVLIYAVAALDRRVYSKGDFRTHEIKLKHSPEVEQWASLLCNDAPNSQTSTISTSREEQLWRNWTKLDAKHRDSSWHLILLYLLDTKPHWALLFVRVLMQEPYVKSLVPSILVDALEHIARLCTGASKAQLHQPGPDVPLVFPTFLHLLRHHLKGTQLRHICSEDILLKASELASTEDLRLLMDLIIDKDMHIGFDTLLHYANKFGRHFDHTYALLCLQRALAQNPSLALARRSIWSCALILRRSTQGGQNYHETTGLVASLLKLGVKLDILLYNVIMSNAMEAGDYETAFRVFDLLEDNNITPDTNSYSILLHGCTVGNDPARFQQFASICLNKAKELKDPWLAAGYLYYLYVRHHEDKVGSQSTVLTYAYSQLFSLDAMGSFLPSLAPSMPNEAERIKPAMASTPVAYTRSEPPLLALYIMLQLEIRKALSLGNAQAWSLFQHFSRLVQEGTYPVLNQLAKDPVIWNAFLLAFCQKQQFANASQLIKSMTDGEIPSIPQPNVYSWNIFLQAFFKNDQVRAAERIYEIMQSRGVQPDQYTFGVLLRGYAKSQHAEKIGEVMVHIEDDRQLDPQVLRALTRFNDRKRLMYELDKSRAAKEEEKGKHEEAAAEEEKRRWEMPKFQSKLASPKSP